jgi:hypothetical protein
MKTIRSISILISVFLSGCVVNLQDTITGNGNVVKQKRDVAEFTGIRVGSGIDVFLSQGDIFSLEVEADENLQEWIRTEVDGTVLNIYTDKNIRLAKTKKVYVTCKILDRLDISLSSAGNASVFVTEEASFRSSSAGSINYKGDPRIKEIHTSSAGSVNKK